MIRMKGDHHAKAASCCDAPSDVLPSRHRLSEATGSKAKHAERGRLSEATLCLQISDSRGDHLPGEVGSTAPMGAVNFHKVDVSTLEGATVKAIVDK